MPHCTTPVTGGGERYSIIYFTNSSLVHANPGALLELQQLGFNLDSLERAGGLETQEDVIGRIRAADTGEERCLVVENLTNAVLGEVRKSIRGRRTGAKGEAYERKAVRR